MKRRILIVVLCIALVAIFLCGFYIGSQIRLQKRAEQVKVGMTYQEVCDLLGRKEKALAPECRSIAGRLAWIKTF